MKLGEFLRRKSWSQADLARALDTSLQNVNKWMNGKGVPSYDFCKKLFEAGIKVEELFDVEYKHYPNEFWDISTRPPSEEEKRFQEGVQRALRDLLGQAGTQKQ